VLCIAFIAYEPQEFNRINSSTKNAFNYGWVVIGALLLIDSLVMGITFTLGIMMPVISRDLGMSLQQVGWLGAMNWEVSAILTIPVTFRFSRYSPKKVVMASCLCEAVLLLAQGLAPNYWLLLLSRIVFISGGLLRFAAVPSLVQQWFPRNKVAKVNTVFTVGSGIAGGTVIFFVGDLIEALGGWRNVFYLFALITAVMFVVWLKLGKERPFTMERESTPDSATLKKILKNKTLWLLGIGITGDMICYGAMETLWPQFATSQGFISLSNAAYCEGLSYYGFTIGSLLGGLLSIRLGRRKPVLYLSGLILPFVTLGILFSRSFSILAVLWLFWGIAELYFPIIMTIPYELPGIKPHEVAVAGAFVLSVYTFGSGLGPLLGSYLAGITGSLKWALGIICVFPILLFITGLIIKETGPRASR
jgi:MFS transporter, DHA1 family, purine base/nucleoside efflux pump